MTASQAFGLLILCALGAGIVWLYVILLRRSDDPGRILAKTVITLIVLAVAGAIITPMMRAGGYVAAFGGIPAAATTGIILAIIWREHITNLVARPFENLFTGGSAPPDPEPFYSIARTKRQQQRFDEAIAEIEAQLERFPGDAKGLLLLAEIQAQNQRNLPAAAGTIERLCVAHESEPRQVAGALTTLADWQLQIARDRDAAQRLFERIRDTFPDHPVAVDAAQRIAHLPTQAMLDEKHERRPLTLPEAPKVVIRDPSEVKVELKSEGPDEAMARLELQLEAHPQDRTAREELAALHANHMRDAARAVEQIEWLLRQPGQEKQNVVRWLNLIADYHLRVGNAAGPAAAALERIERKYPGSPAATQAARRKMTLGRELKGNEKSREVTLGSYDRDLGLR